MTLFLFVCCRIFVCFRCFIVCSPVLVYLFSPWGFVPIRKLKIRYYGAYGNQDHDGCIEILHIKGRKTAVQEWFSFLYIFQSFWSHERPNMALFQLCVRHEIVSYLQNSQFNLFTDNKYTFVNHTTGNNREMINRDAKLDFQMTLLVTLT